MTYLKYKLEGGSLYLEYGPFSGSYFCLDRDNGNPELGTGYVWLGKRADLVRLRNAQTSESARLSLIYPLKRMPEILAEARHEPD